MIDADESFRIHLPNQQADGGRKWLYPRATSGRFTRWRTWVAWVLLACLFAGPFVWVDGHPLFLFNVIERRFVVFGVPFWPQDFYLVAIGLITFVVFIALFTVVFGRVWCGWACPQTIFMEMVFRKIETLIEGDHNAKRRLDAGPWTTEKVAKKTAKHGVFFLISFLISNTFLAYLIGRDQLVAIITDNPAQHLGGLASMLVFTGVFYLVFARLREIVCTTICPYGRLQGVMLDKNSLVVAYDYLRGEPRGKRVKNEELKIKSENHFSLLIFNSPKGDCVDCKLCVQVCPTGIDIRNGIQLECINCTACMDACDEVMDKISRPRGLIRIDSQNGIEQRRPFRLTGRIVAYSAVLLGLLGLMGFLLISRPAADVTVLRAPGQLYQRGPGQTVSNLYSVEIINKTYQSMSLTIKPERTDARLRFVQPLYSLPPGSLTKALFFIDLPERAIHASSTPVTLHITANGEPVSDVKTTFLGPTD
ncbi:cytochrome c oxidase accessory protein CcoG [Spirosoma montaniterrae]|uniref:Cytochrome c oxidase accessory protein CcoG n=1 Tax=Spirosoma montaniterrae TaxID=1178516 RepID=A0A1P9WU57_9BACT|nr:cytochrome c oxidase accessory protein CcoG [Spirosoma montaniterrae]AQG78914.1 cytochrome c oxidase accessory protein CcoG [Spirosoma montaniterrae]